MRGFSDLALQSPALVARSNKIRRKIPTASDLDEVREHSFGVIGNVENIYNSDSISNRNIKLPILANQTQANNTTQLLSSDNFSSNRKSLPSMQVRSLY